MSIANPINLILYLLLVIIVGIIAITIYYEKRYFNYLHHKLAEAPADFREKYGDRFKTYLKRRRSVLTALNVITIAISLMTLYGLITANEPIYLIGFIANLIIFASSQPYLNRTGLKINQLWQTYAKTIKKDNP